MAKQFTCGDEAFLVKSNDEKEVFDVAKMHMKRFHSDKNISDQELKKYIIDA